MYKDSFAETGVYEEARALNACGLVVIDSVGGSMSVRKIEGSWPLISLKMAPGRSPAQDGDIPKIASLSSSWWQTRINSDIPCYGRPCSLVVLTCIQVFIYQPVLVPRLKVGRKLAWVPSFKMILNSWEGLVMTAGLPIGTDLNKQAADDLRLLAGTPVGSAVIDA